MEFVHGVKEVDLVGLVPSPARGRDGHDHHFLAEARLEVRPEVAHLVMNHKIVEHYCSMSRDRRQEVVVVHLAADRAAHLMLGSAVCCQNPWKCSTACDQSVVVSASDPSAGHGSPYEGNVT